MTSTDFQTTIAGFTCYPKTFLTMLQKIADTLPDAVRASVVVTLQTGEAKQLKIIENAIGDIGHAQHQLTTFNRKLDEEDDRKNEILPSFSL